MTEQTLDLQGAICPDPLPQVQAVMGRLAIGDRLVVSPDYPLAVENISRWAKDAGLPMEVEKTGVCAWKLTLVKM